MTFTYNFISIKWCSHELITSLIKHLYSTDSDTQIFNWLSILLVSKRASMKRMKISSGSRVTLWTPGGHQTTLHLFSKIEEVWINHNSHVGATHLSFIGSVVHLKVEIWIFLSTLSTYFGISKYNKKSSI